MGVILIIVIIALMGLIMPVMMNDLDMSKTKLADYKYQNTIIAREQMIDNLKTIYRGNYDYINIPIVLLPNVTSTEKRSVMDMFVEEVSKPDNVKSGHPIVFNRERVCQYNAEDTEAKKGHYICTGIWGANSKVLKPLVEQTLHETSPKGAEAIKKLIGAVPTNWFVSFERINEKYINVELPSLIVKIYRQDPDGKIPDGNAEVLEANFNGVINSMINDAKRINDGIYDKYGEYAKRNFKGLIKTDIVSQHNPFAVIGDALSMKERIDAGETLPNFLVMGTQALSGFSTSDSIVIRFSRLDKQASSLFGSGCRVINTKMEPASMDAIRAAFSDKYYYACEKDARRIYNRICKTTNSEDENCDKEIDDKLKLTNFCLSTEACFAEYTTNEDETLKEVKASSIDYMLEKKFNLGVKSYTNPFYPNYLDTLIFEKEQKGLIFSSNNEGLPQNKGQYFFIIGMKYVPTGFDSYDKNTKDFYILNKYVIQGK